MLAEYVDNMASEIKSAQLGLCSIFIVPVRTKYMYMDKPQNMKNHKIIV
jgi:hypothetical protein